MADINIYGTLTNVTGEPIASAEQIGDGYFYQSEINEHLMQGEIYDPLADSGKGAWVSNTSDPTEATTDKLGGIKIAGNREVQQDNPIIKGRTDNVLDRLYGVELDQTGTAFVHVPWDYPTIPIASKDSLGRVKGGDDTGIVIDSGGVVKADFDDTDYSNIGDMSEEDYPNNKVASPYVVNKIVEAKLQKAIGDILDTPM